MGNMRTMAFQVPEDLFQQIKDYLERHNMTQKQFVLGLIQDELDRDYEKQQQSEDEPDEHDVEELGENDNETEDEGEDLDDSEDMNDSEGEDMSMGM